MMNIAISGCVPVHVEPSTCFSIKDDTPFGGYKYNCVYCGKEALTFYRRTLEEGACGDCPPPLESMNWQQFKDWAVRHDANIHRTNESFNQTFQISCKKCDGKNVKIVDDIEINSDSCCSTCGNGGYTKEGSMTFKCPDCGAGAIFIKAEDLNR